MVERVAVGLKRPATSQRGLNQNYLQRPIMSVMLISGCGKAFVFQYFCTALFLVLQRVEPVAGINDAS
jgi:hypothetical protein